MGNTVVITPETHARSRHPEAERPEQRERDAIVPRDGMAVDALHQIIGFDALLASMYRCCRGVMWKDSTISFLTDAVERVSTLSRQLEEGTYRPSRPNRFYVTYPKRRAITSITFRDRVYQRSLNDNGVYPLMSRSWVYDNAACQKGKGTDFARERMKCHLQRFYRKHGTHGWALHIDIAGYYDNIRHDVAIAKFARRLPPWMLGMVTDVLDGQYPGEKGYSAGSQLVQIVGVSMLDDIDHFVKEWLRVKHYMRYMDDLMLIHHDADYLMACLEQITARLELIGLTPHPVKTRITPITKNVRWLGFDFRVTDTGKVLMLIDPRKVKSERRRLARLVALAKKGLRTRAKCDECYQSWRSHAAKGSSRRLLARMDEYYERLWD